MKDRARQEAAAWRLRQDMVAESVRGVAALHARAVALRDSSQSTHARAAAIGLVTSAPASNPGVDQQMMETRRELAWIAREVANGTADIERELEVLSETLSVLETNTRAFGLDVGTLKQRHIEVAEVREAVRAMATEVAALHDESSDVDALCPSHQIEANPEIQSLREELAMLTELAVQQAQQPRMVQLEVNSESSEGDDDGLGIGGEFQPLPAPPMDDIWTDLKHVALRNMWLVFVTLLIAVVIIFIVHTASS